MIQWRAALIPVAQPDRRPDDAGGDSIMDGALRMGVDDDIVAVLPQLPQILHGLNSAHLEQVLLMDRVEVRVALQEVFRAGPEHESVNHGLRVVDPQFVNQWRGDQAVPDPRQRDDQNSHSVAMFVPSLTASVARRGAMILGQKRPEEQYKIASQRRPTQPGRPF